jgi:hypothetical protein
MTLVRQRIRYAILPIALSALMFGVMFYRLHFGVDFTDESFYLAMAYNFHLGGRPFVDEINLVQLSAWIFSPLVGFYGLFVPSLDGLMLFIRKTYWVILILVAATGYISLYRVTKEHSLAALLALSCAAFVPFNIFALSYNTLGSSCFVLGAFLLARGWLYKPSVSGRVFAGVAHGLAVLAYPSMVIALALIYPLLFMREGRQGWLSILQYGGSAMLVGAVVLLPIVFDAGWENIAYSVNYTSSFGSQHMSNIKQLFFGLFRHAHIVLIWLAAVYWAQKRLPGLAKGLVVMFPIIWLAVSGIKLPHAGWYVVDYALAAPLLLVFLSRDVLARRILLYIWLPALAVGANAAWSSGGGAIAAANGLIIGGVATSWLLARLYQQICANETNRKSYTIGHLLPPVMVVIVLVGFQFNSVYRDATMPGLDSKVGHGVYAGIYTTQAKAAFVGQLKQDLDAVQLQAPHGGILSFDDFPAGYLFSTRRSASNTAWLFPGEISQHNSARTDLVKRFQMQQAYPGIVLEINGFPYDAKGWKQYRHSTGDSLTTLVRGQQYRSIIQRKGYEIYVRQR